MYFQALVPRCIHGQMCGLFFHLSGKPFTFLSLDRFCTTPRPRPNALVSVLAPELGACLDSQLHRTTAQPHRLNHKLGSVAELAIGCKHPLLTLTLLCAPRLGTLSLCLSVLMDDHFNSCLFFLSCILPQTRLHHQRFVPPWAISTPP